MKTHTQNQGPTLRRRSIIGVIGAVSILAVAACGSPAPQPGQTPASTASVQPAGGGDVPQRGNADLVIWTDLQTAPVLQDAVRQFGEQNGISVAVQGVNNLQTAFITADAAGSGPDVVVGANDWIGNMVQNGAVDPVTAGQPQLKSLEPVALNAVTYNKQTYGIPYAFESVVLFRNKALAPVAPANFEELAGTGLELVKSGKAKLPLSLQIGQLGEPYSMQPLYSSAGGYLFGTGPDGTVDTSDVGVGKEGSIKFAQKLAEYGEKGSGVLSRSVSPDNAISLFTEGTIPYLVSGPWAIPTLKKAGIDYGISEVPGFAGEQPAAPFVGVQAFFVAAHGKNKSLAQEFVGKAALSPETQLALYRSQPRPPALSSALAQASQQDTDTATIAAAAAKGMPLPSVPQMVSVWGPLGQAEANIVGGADPQSTMAQAGQTIASKGK